MVLEAQARAQPVMIAFIIGAWFVGVPLSYYLGLGRTAKSFVGVWTGLVSGYAVTSSIGFYYAYCTSSWDEQARRAVDRSKQKNKRKNRQSGHETDPLLV